MHILPSTNDSLPFKIILYAKTEGNKNKYILGFTYIQKQKH